LIKRELASNTQPTQSNSRNAAKPREAMKDSLVRSEDNPDVRHVKLCLITNF
jgi:hypothetical protein